MPITDFRELTVATDPSSKVDITTSGSHGSGTLAIATDGSTKLDLTTAPGASFGRALGALLLAANGASKINFTRTTGSKFGTLALTISRATKVDAVAAPRRMGPSTIAGIPISGQIWPRSN